MTQACAECDTDLNGRADRLFCSDACRQRAYRHRQHEADVERRDQAAFAWLTARMADLPPAGASRNAEFGPSRNELADR